LGTPRRPGSIMLRRFGKSSKRKARVPNLVNLTLSQAQSLLSSLGINYTTSTTSTSDQSIDGKVKNQNVAENETKLVGDSVELNYYSFGFTPFGFTPFGFTPFSFTPNLCFVVGTDILMADGSTKKIEDIVIGDSLKSFNIPNLDDDYDPDLMNTENAWITPSTDDFTITPTTVTYIGRRPVLKTIKFNNLHRCTENHAIFVNRGGDYQWLKAKDVQVGDSFIKFDKTEEMVSNKETIDELTEVVAIDCEIKDFYFANGILVHNITVTAPPGTTTQWVS